MCARDEEMIQHLFIDCETVRHIRSYIHDVVFMHWSHSDLYKKGELKTILDHAGELHWRRLQLFTCFIDWRERCNRIFREQGKTVLDLVREIKIQYQLGIEA
jgi:hypothetical protein